MGRFFSFMAALGLLAAAVLVLAGSANAAPMPDGKRVAFTLTNEPWQVLVWSSGCHLVPASGALTADVQGWEGPNSDGSGTVEVLLHASVGGTLTDTTGTAYRVHGEFLQQGRSRDSINEVPFDGFGHITAIGPTGVVSGWAEFRDVADSTFEVIFARIDACTIHLR
jgi:hypothetical protein